MNIYILTMPGDLPIIYKIFSQFRSIFSPFLLPELACWSRAGPGPAKTPPERRRGSSICPALALITAPWWWRGSSPSHRSWRPGSPPPWAGGPGPAGGLAPPGAALGALRPGGGAVWPGPVGLTPRRSGAATPSHAQVSRQEVF